MEIDFGKKERCKGVEQVIQTAVEPLAERLRAAIGPASADVAALSEALRGAMCDPSPAIRAEAVSLLGYLAELMQRVSDDAISEMPTALPAISAGIADPDARVRAAAVRSANVFVALAPTDHLPVVIGRLRDPDAEVCKTAVELIREVAGLAPVAVAEALIPIVEKAVDYEPHVVLGTLEALRQAGPDAAGIAVPALVALLHNRRTAIEVRLASCSLLGWLGRDAEAATATLLEIATGITRGPCEPAVRVGAVRALLNIGSLPDQGAAIRDQRDREELMMILRQVAPEATALRQQLEASWRKLPTPQAADAPVEQVSQVRESAGECQPQLTEMIQSLASEVRQLKEQKSAEVPKELYTTKEIAERTGFKESTIRKACRQERILASKGPNKEWRINHEELLKIQNEGLPPESE